MKYNYKIEFNLDKDVWNWYDATRNAGFEGLSWRDNTKDSFRDEFDKISELPDEEAKKEAKKFVEKLHKEKASEYNSLKWWIENEFNKKFNKACGWLKEITKHELVCDNFTVLLTTFPRADEFMNKGEVFFCIYWVNPIENFLHEILHWQFQKYWRENPDSPVSRLNNNEWEFLKESLTVIIDCDAKPLVNFEDSGYPAHQDFRNILHKEWQKHHDFEKLVDFGLKELSRL
jgi:hypothetical protein